MAKFDSHYTFERLPHKVTIKHQLREQHADSIAKEMHEWCANNFPRKQWRLSNYACYRRIDVKFATEEQYLLFRLRWL